MKLNNLQKSALLIIIGCISELQPKAPTVVYPTNKVQEIEQTEECYQTCYTRTIKVTRYYTPRISCMGYSKEGYDVDITVNKKKYYFKYIDVQRMEMEGFVHVYSYDIDKNGNLVEDNFYLDHNRHKQSCVLDSKGRPLKVGDIASNYYSDSTVFVYREKEHLKTDNGSAINGKFHIDEYRGEQIPGSKDTKVTTEETVTVYPYYQPIVYVEIPKV